MSHQLDDFTLLIDGAEAFPEILSCIGRARTSIHINMFIWRDDHIGNAIARAILEAADRGVRVSLSIDRVGAVLELAEEYRSSFFHKRITLTEWLKVGVLRCLYPALSTARRPIDRDNALYYAIMNHPNITADLDTFKADHSKYYIFDDETLILGGINIEDKENGSDISGRVYQDYMVKLTGAVHVRGLKTALNTGKADFGGYGFCVNSKECSPPRFAIRGHYLDLIQGAQEELLIAMAYFAPPREFLQAIAEASARGVRVTLLIPARSNLMNSASLRAARRLMRQTGNRVQLCLTPKMMHTKLIATEHQISFGSANMMKNAFLSLSELNLFLPRTQHPFCQRLMDSVAAQLALSQRVERGETLRCSPLLAWLEGLFQ